MRWNPWVLMRETKHLPSPPPYPIMRPELGRHDMANLPWFGRSVADTIASL